METWQLISAGGAVLGLLSLGGIGFSLKKLEGGAKWGALIASLLLGAAGGYMVLNATALTTSEEEAQIDEAAEAADDFDAPLDDDF